MTKLRGQTMNMTTGSPLPLLLAFVLPMLIGNVFQQMYNIVDSSVVGRFVGADALAAVGSTGSITFLFIGVSNGIGAGCGVVTSQYLGAGEDGLVASPSPILPTSCWPRCGDGPDSLCCCALCAANDGHAC